jgi:hypothetical protein
MVAVKLIPHLLSWAGIVLVLARAFKGRRPVVAPAVAFGFAAGEAVAFILLRSFQGDTSYGIIRDVVGGTLLLLWGVSVAAIYRSSVRDFTLSWGEKAVNSPYYAGAVSLLAGVPAGAICACRLSGSAVNATPYLLLFLAAIVLVFAALAAEKPLPPSFTVSQAGLMTIVVALLIFSSSSIIRLDLFSPLTMKVMKFTHDFVHQFFESMLVPDHLFIRNYLWGYIGFLFGNEVGFWGGLFIWFTPVVLVALAINLERLPSVAHIRRGAERRKIMYAAIRARHIRLVIPAVAAVILAAAAYRSRYPSVEYWDPKPVQVSADPTGEIFIPKKGEIDLSDGKIHKYIFKKGGTEARFFILVPPQGKLTVDLDACAICKPEGYGQAEGTVICYYCKTLIPLETVGRPGGCNPVPIPFTEKEDGVRIDAITLVNDWNNTVQSTSRIKGGGK